MRAIDLLISWIGVEDFSKNTNDCLVLLDSDSEPGSVLGLRMALRPFPNSCQNSQVYRGQSQLVQAGRGPLTHSAGLPLGLPHTDRGQEGASILLLTTPIRILLLVARFSLRE